jgi:tRNA-modifying protein YgfZ
VPDVTTDYLAIREDVGAVDVPRDFVRVSGPDSLSFLQGQLSQDVDLPPGGSAWALLLQPQGKMVALLRVTRPGDEEFVLDTDGGWAGAVVERLNMFKLRVKADLEPLPWRCVALRGPRAHEAAATGAATRLAADWPGLPGVDLVGDDPQAPEGIRRCSLDAYQAVRIEAGVPAMGAEIDERTIPAEVGVVERAVSFTKGCYTGQELVARIDSRGGNVPRRLRGVVMGTNVIPPPGATLAIDGKEVGELTSVGESFGRRAPVALAYVRRAVEPPAEAVVRWDGGSAPARIEALPLVS